MEKQEGAKRYGKNSRKIRVLFADDDLHMRTLLKYNLGRAGFDVISSGDGRELLGRVSDKIDVVLLDLQMPEISGMECLKRINTVFPDVSSIMLTCSSDVAKAVEAMKNGAFDYITKPFNMDELIAAVVHAARLSEQGRRLRQVEAELERAKAHEKLMAARIQETLLQGKPPGDIRGIDVAGLMISPREVGGDFYDFCKLGSNSFDLVVGDVMGKGIPAALLGAAIRKRFADVLNRVIRLSCGKMRPEPKDVVKGVHGEMISQLVALETFVTLCYARFDLGEGSASYVDCGHVRTIHFQKKMDACTLLQGENMPLGFPYEGDFIENRVCFGPGDLFLFYSDGVTEAKDSRGNQYGESRLMRFVRKHSAVPTKTFVRRVKEEIAEFTRGNQLADDFTCVAIKIEENEQPARLEIDSDLGELTRVRRFVRTWGKTVPEISWDPSCLNRCELAVNEVAANIIRHGYCGRSGNRIIIEARAQKECIDFRLYDRGKVFVPRGIPPLLPDGFREGGFGMHIIEYCVDDVTYDRDENGMNCACLKLFFTGG